MPAESSIPEVLRAEVRGLSRQGQSTRQIAAWLGDEHKLKVSHHAVARLLSAQRGEEDQERGEVRALVLASAVKAEALSLEMVERQAQGVHEVCERLRGELLDVLDTRPPRTQLAVGESELLPKGEASDPALPPEAVALLRAKTIAQLHGPYLRTVGELRKLWELKRGPVGTAAPAGTGGSTGGGTPPAEEKQLGEELT